jgi:hypothetical protein
VEIRSLKLLEREQIIRRLRRLTGPSYIARPTEITRYDLAKWIGMDAGHVRAHMRGAARITDAFQIIYSQFFQLVDNGELVIEYNKKTKEKVLLRVPAPPAPPKRKLQPAIDFATMRLKLD